jgi:uncharacterized protein YukE
MSGSRARDDLPTIAREVRAQAGALRAISIRIAIVSATTRWESVASARFRDRVQDVALALRTAADRLDHAADRVEQHAARLAAIGSR